ncbi:hypothetical protein BT69DRAFT_1297268 [Atractiella rhizophila]|nr:hypothetical protein BT69DRAFT_1297268 [Atractiella rhizophila]
MHGLFQGNEVGAGIFPLEKVFQGDMGMVKVARWIGDVLLAFKEAQEIGLAGLMIGKPDDTLEHILTCTGITSELKDLVEVALSELAPGNLSEHVSAAIKDWRDGGKRSKEDIEMVDEKGVGGREKGMRSDGKNSIRNCAGPTEISDWLYDFFKEHHANLNPGYNLPSETHFRDFLLVSEGARIRLLLTKSLKNQQNLSISFDGGTTTGHDSIYTSHVATPANKIAGRKLGVTKFMVQSGTTRWAGSYYVAEAVNRCFNGITTLVEKETISFPKGQCRCQLDEDLNALFTSGAASFSFRARLHLTIKLYKLCTRAIVAFQSPNITLADIFLHWIIIIANIKTLCDNLILGDGLFDLRNSITEVFNKRFQQIICPCDLTPCTVYHSTNDAYLFDCEDLKVRIGKELLSLFESTFQIDQSKGQNLVTLFVDQVKLYTDKAQPFNSLFVFKRDQPIERTMSFITWIQNKYPYKLKWETTMDLVMCREYYLEEYKKEMEDMEEEIERDLAKAHLEKDEKDLSVLEWIKKELEPTEEDNALKSILASQLEREAEKLVDLGNEELVKFMKGDAKDGRNVMKGSLKVEKKADNVGWDKQKEAENMFI